MNSGLSPVKKKPDDVFLPGMSQALYSLPFSREASTEQNNMQASQGRTQGTMSKESSCGRPLSGTTVLSIDSPRMHVSKDLPTKNQLRKSFQTGGRHKWVNVNTQRSSGAPGSVAPQSAGGGEGHLASSLQRRLAALQLLLSIEQIKTKRDGSRSVMSVATPAPSLLSMESPHHTPLTAPVSDPITDNSMLLRARRNSLKPVRVGRATESNTTFFNHLQKREHSCTKEVLDNLDSYSGDLDSWECSTYIHQEPNVFLDTPSLSVPIHSCPQSCPQTISHTLSSLSSPVSSNASPSSANIAGDSAAFSDAFTHPVPPFAKNVDSNPPLGGIRTQFSEFQDHSVQFPESSVLAPLGHSETDVCFLPGSSFVGTLRTGCPQHDHTGDSAVLENRAVQWPDDSSSLIPLQYVNGRAVHYQHQHREVDSCSLPPLGNGYTPENCAPLSGSSSVTGITAEWTTTSLASQGLPEDSEALKSLPEGSIAHALQRLPDGSVVLQSLPEGSVVHALQGHSIQFPTKVAFERLRERELLHASESGLLEDHSVQFPESCALTVHDRSCTGVAMSCTPVCIAEHKADTSVLPGSSLFEDHSVMFPEPSSALCLLNSAQCKQQTCSLSVRGVSVVTIGNNGLNAAQKPSNVIVSRKVAEHSRGMSFSDMMNRFCKAEHNKQLAQGVEQQQQQKQVSSASMKKRSRVVHSRDRVLAWLACCSRPDTIHEEEERRSEE